MPKPLEDILELEKQGYRATAVRRLRDYLRDFPGDAEGWYYLARFSTKPKEQIQAIERALHLEPDYLDAQEFRAVLLEEHPQLESAGGRRWLLLVLLLAVIITSGAVLAIAVPPLLEEEPEVVVVVPTTEIPPTETIIDIPSPTTAATRTPTEPQPTATPNIASPTPPEVTSAPTTSATTTPVVVDESTALTILVADFDAAPQVTNQLSETFAGKNLIFVGVDNAIANPTEASTALQTESASAILYLNSAGDSLTLYSEDAPTLYRNHPDLAFLARIPAPLSLSFAVSADNLAEGRGVAAINGALAFLAYDFSDTIQYLAPAFDSPTSVLDDTQSVLAFMLAYAYQAEGDSREALRVYDILNTYTSDPTEAILINRALAIAATGDPDSALPILERLQSQGADSAFMQVLIGNVYAQLPDGADAARLAFEDAINRDASAGYPFLARARLLIQQGAVNRALDDFASAINRDRSFALAYYERAALRGQLGMTADALQDIETAINIQPQIGVYHALKGQLLAQDEQWELASTAYETALALGDTRAVTYAQLAQAYYELGNLDGALRESDNALEQDAATAAAWLYRGLAYLAQNDVVAGINAFNQGLQIDTENVPLLVARCSAHAHSGDDGAAATDCDSALALEPDNGYALEQRGLIRYRSGDRAGAASDFAEAVTYVQDAYEALYHLGFFAAQEQRFDTALDYFTRTIEIAPFLGKAYKERGIVYRVSGAWELAIADLDRAINLLPDDVYLYYELGLAKRALADRASEAGNAAQAISLYQEAREAFLIFLNGSQPDAAFVPEALAAVEYTDNALNVLQGQ